MGEAPRVMGMLLNGSIKGIASVEKWLGLELQSCGLCVGMKMAVVYIEIGDADISL